MSYLIAAAGTGGHVFPGLAVAEALVDLGVARREILFAGGDRLEATVYPEEGFPFLELNLRGLQRSVTLKNLTLPVVVSKAKTRIQEAIRERAVKSALGMGGYVTIPTALAARKTRVRLFVAEQNAAAGLANRVASRWAERSFVSFPKTSGIDEGEWVGNPVREPFWYFDRSRLRDSALARYRVDADRPVLGVFGGSLGAGVINDAVAEMVATWDGGPMQVVHLTGEAHLEKLDGLPEAPGVVWRRIAFEESMESFYAVSDLVVARAGGAVAELSATGTPAILVPGRFGSSGHQFGNARFFTEEGAAVTLDEADLRMLRDVVKSELFNAERLEAMAQSARRIAKPRAARTIAEAMIRDGR